MTGAERLEHLAVTVGPDVLGYLVRRTSQGADAADVYAEVLAVTWQRLPVVPADDREAFGWMIGVARRCLANHRRSSTRRSDLAGRLRAQLELASTEPRDPDAALDAERALSRLTAEDRELVTLVYWEGFTVAEAAASLELSAATGRKRLERARAALRSRVVATG